jgi:hypothetical protein
MTNPDLTLIAALLDRTGSMESCKRATEDGFNELINSQKQLPDRAVVTLAQFDQHPGAPVPDSVYTNKPITDVPKLNLKPRGMTPLLDATGAFITSIGAQLNALEEDRRPGKVICLIMTDGMENASTEWTWERVQELIKQQTEVYSWQFMFLGANIDAVQVGGRMGFTRDASITYDSADYDSTNAVWAATSANVSGLRSGLQANASYSPDQRDEAMGRKKRGKSR